jgi:hypothetical protein
MVIAFTAHTTPYTSSTGRQRMTTRQLLLAADFTRWLSSVSAEGWMEPERWKLGVGTQWTLLSANLQTK